MSIPKSSQNDKVDLEQALRFLATERFEKLKQAEEARHFLNLLGVKWSELEKEPIDSIKLVKVRLLRSLVIEQTILIEDLLTLRLEDYFQGKLDECDYDAVTRRVNFRDIVLDGMRFHKKIEALEKIHKLGTGIGDAFKRVKDCRNALVHSLYPGFARQNKKEGVRGTQIDKLAYKYGSNNLFEVQGLAAFIKDISALMKYLRELDLSV